MAGPEELDEAEILVDLSAIRHNCAILTEVIAPAQLMAVVKADAYGHGLEPVAHAARAAGVPWLGVARVAEGLELRRLGDTGRILAWLDLPGQVPYEEAVRQDIDMTAYSRRELRLIAAAGRSVGRAARVQLKVDTGLSRGGCPTADWPRLVAEAREWEEEGQLRVTGIWSHFACSDDPEHPSNDAQERVFREALAIAETAGLRPEVRHLANSAAAVLRSSSRFDLVRAGLLVYGLDPAPGHLPDLDLRPAMTVQTPLAMAKPIAAGTGVSYGHTWVAEHPTTVGLVPAGYAEGIPRHASSRAEVWVAGRRRPVRGTICMDQFVVDLDGDLPEPGTRVLVFGPGDHGEPTAQDWAEASGTISYEIVTRIGGRMVRRYVEEDQR
ncbi:MAG: alanine racemase [Nocardioides sp.]|uniref:alanine racemase n=1 Tax=Nocardioides sp. TaxID=35761 RepID=UPI0039E69A46